MTKGETIKSNGSGSEGQVSTGLEIIAGQNGEGQNGHHPLETITAVIGLTQEVNKASARRAIDIAKEIGLTRIDELDELVEASSRVRVIDSPNGYHEPATVPIELEKQEADQAAESAVAPEKAGRSEGDDHKGQHSEYFDLPNTRTKAGKRTFKGSMQEVLVEFFDEQQSLQDEGQYYSLEDGSGRGAINKLVLHIEDKLKERDIIMDHSKRQLFNQVVYILRDRGYLVLETSTGGRVCSSITVGEITQEDLKKN